MGSVRLRPPPRSPASKKLMAGPSSEKNGGTPRRAAMVPTVKLGCAAVVGPARPGVEVAAVKEEMAVGPA
jgi:hypothetical protein